MTQSPRPYSFYYNYQTTEIYNKHFSKGQENGGKAVYPKYEAIKSRFNFSNIYCFLGPWEQFMNGVPERGMHRSPDKGRKKAGRMQLGQLVEWGLQFAVLTAAYVGFDKTKTHTSKIVVRFLNYISS